MKETDINRKRFLNDDFSKMEAQVLDVKTLIQNLIRIQKKQRSQKKNSLTRSLVGSKMTLQEQQQLFDEADLSDSEVKLGEVTKNRELDFGFGHVGQPNDRVHGLSYLHTFFNLQRPGELDKQIFKLISKTKLYLKNIQLMNMPNLPSLGVLFPNLLHLDLSGNKLKQIEAEALTKNLPLLQVLDVSSNRLRDFREIHALHVLVNLHTLDIRHNEKLSLASLTRSALINVLLTKESVDKKKLIERQAKLILSQYKGTNPEIAPDQHSFARMTVDEIKGVRNHADGGVIRAEELMNRTARRTSIVGSLLESQFHDQPAHTPRHHGRFKQLRTLNGQCITIKELLTSGFLEFFPEEEKEARKLFLEMIQNKQEKWKNPGVFHRGLVRPVSQTTADGNVNLEKSSMQTSRPSSSKAAQRGTNKAKAEEKASLFKSQSVAVLDGTSRAIPLRRVKQKKDEPKKVHLSKKKPHEIMLEKATKMTREALNKIKKTKQKLNRIEKQEREEQKKDQKFDENVKQLFDDLQEDIERVIVIPGLDSSTETLNRGEQIDEEIDQLIAQYNKVRSEAALKVKKKSIFESRRSSSRNKSILMTQLQDSAANQLGPIEEEVTDIARLRQERKMEAKLKEMAVRAEKIEYQKQISKRMNMGKVYLRSGVELPVFKPEEISVLSIPATYQNLSISEQRKAQLYQAVYGGTTARQKREKEFNAKLEQVRKDFNIQKVQTNETPTTQFISECIPTLQDSVRGTKFTNLRFHKRDIMKDIENGAWMLTEDDESKKSSHSSQQSNSSMDLSQNNLLQTNINTSQIGSPQSSYNQITGRSQGKQQKIDAFTQQKIAVSQNRRLTRHVPNWSDTSESLTSQPDEFDNTQMCTVTQHTEDHKQNIDQDVQKQKLTALTSEPSCVDEIGIAIQSFSSEENKTAKGQRLKTADARKRPTLVIRDIQPMERSLGQKQHAISSPQSRSRQTKPKKDQQNSSIRSHTQSRFQLLERQEQLAKEHIQNNRQDFHRALVYVKQLMYKYKKTCNHDYFIKAKRVFYKELVSAPYKQKDLLTPDLQLKFLKMLEDPNLLQMESSIIRQLSEMKAKIQADKEQDKGSRVAGSNGIGASVLQVEGKVGDGVDGGDPLIECLELYDKRDLVALLLNKVQNDYDSQDIFEFVKLGRIFCDVPRPVSLRTLKRLSRNVSESGLRLQEEQEDKIKKEILELNGLGGVQEADVLKVKFPPNISKEGETIWQQKIRRQYRELFNRRKHLEFVKRMKPKKKSVSSPTDVTQRRAAQQELLDQEEKHRVQLALTQREKTGYQHLDAGNNNTFGTIPNSPTEISQQKQTKSIMNEAISKQMPMADQMFKIIKKLHSKERIAKKSSIVDIKPEVGQFKLKTGSIFQKTPNFNDLFNKGKKKIFPLQSLEEIVSNPSKLNYTRDIILKETQQLTDQEIRDQYNKSNLIIGSKYRFQKSKVEVQDLVKKSDHLQDDLSVSTTSIDEDNEQSRESLNQKIRLKEKKEFDKIFDPQIYFEDLGIRSARLALPICLDQMMKSMQKKSPRRVQRQLSKQPSFFGSSQQSNNNFMQQTSCSAQLEKSLQQSRSADLLSKRIYNGQQSTVFGGLSETELQNKRKQLKERMQLLARKEIVEDPDRHRQRMLSRIVKHSTKTHSSSHQQ